MRAHKFSNTQKPKEEQAKRHELCFLDFKKKILRRIYMFWIELVILLLLIAWGVRKGGVFLTLAGGIGAFVFTFI